MANFTPPAWITSFARNYTPLNSKQKLPIFPTKNLSTAPFLPRESCPIWVLVTGHSWAQLGTTIRTSSEGRSRGKLFLEFSWNEIWTCKRHLFLKCLKQTYCTCMHDFQMTILFGATNFPKGPPSWKWRKAYAGIRSPRPSPGLKMDRSPEQGSSSTTRRTRVLTSVGYHKHAAVIGIDHQTPLKETGSMSPNTEVLAEVIFFKGW